MNLVQNFTIMKDIKELEKIRLLPLMSNDKRLPIIAALIGYCDTDGHITKLSSSFCMGCEEDMKSIKNAVYSIGFKLQKGKNVKALGHLQMVEQLMKQHGEFL